MPTITGLFTLPGDNSPLTGTWSARIATADGTGVVSDTDGSLRGGVESATDLGSGANMTLPVGWYDFTWESLVKINGDRVRFGPVRFNVSVNTTWGAIRDAAPGLGPLQLTQFEQLSAALGVKANIVDLDNPATDAGGRIATTYDLLPGATSTITKNDLRLFGIFYPELYGAVGNGVADDTAAIQACIDAAQAAISGGGTSGYGKVPTIHFYGRYKVTSTLQWKSAHLVGPVPLDGGVIQWDGPAGGTVIAKWGTAHTGGASYARLEGLAMLPGANEPGTWVDFTTAPFAQALVDKFGQIRDMQFGPCTSDAIRVGRWVNAHWSGLRFDSVGGFCIKLTPAADVNLASFAVDDFTYDHRRTTIPGKGFIGVDTTALTSGNLGVIRLSKGRIEHNVTNLDAKAGVFVVVTTAASGPRIGFQLDDATVANASGVTPVPYLYRDTVSTTDRPDLLLTHVVSNNSPVLGGTKPTNTADYPVGSYAYLDLNSGAMVTTNFDIRAFAVGDQVMGVRQGVDTTRRFAVTSDGRLDFSSGSAAADARMYRPAAGVVGMLLGVFRHQTCTTATRPNAATVGAGAEVYDTDLGITITSNGSVWRNASGTAV